MKRTILLVMTFCFSLASTAWSDGRIQSGLYRYLKPDGTLVSLESRQGLRLHGFYFEYYDSGDMKKQFTYEHGRLDGISRKYYPNRNLREERWFQRGRQEGEAKKFYPSGSLEVEMVMRNNQRDGEVKFYDKRGRLKQVVTYDRDKIVDIQRVEEGAPAAQPAEETP